MEDSWKKLLLGLLQNRLESTPLELLTQMARNPFPPPSPPPQRLIPEAPESGTLRSFDGIEIYWERHGPDPRSHPQTPLLFCYGLVCSMNQWRAQLEHFAPHRPCLFFDYRGHHRSEIPEDPASLNISALAKDAAAVLHFLEIEQGAHVWGHSLGVNVALELALAEPTLCRSLILCCGTIENPFHNMFGTQTLEKWFTPWVRNYAQHPELFAALWKILQIQPGTTQWAAQHFGFNMEASTLKDVETYAQSVASISPRVFFPLLSDLTRATTRGSLPKIKTPLLALAGGHDHITPPQIMKELASLVPQGEYTEIPAGSHNVQLDFGEYVALKVERFWKERALD